MEGGTPPPSYRRELDTRGRMSGRSSECQIVLPNYPMGARRC
ncbi:hypothetical protein E2C01_075359 [Portunus trituberculatus]|uniref:Uncharacterized protein n=1 Tax=Portunus trituberculatus TaxID=210409 RepID=A0A5B7IGV7_PORTR|nr:hypothetical protein [Portunus trituberculatus]